MSDHVELVSYDDRQWLLQEAHRLIEFATGSLERGGAFGWLDHEGHRQPRPPELYIGCRMTHVFSIGEALWKGRYREYLDAGVDALSSIFADRIHGGWFNNTDHCAVKYPKTAYGHCFVTLAAASAAARGVPGGDGLLQEALSVINRRFWDDASGLVRESFSRDWTQCEPYRGSNSNMHAVEAFLAARDVTGDNTWLRRALRIADRVINNWARSNDWRVPEHFTGDWTMLADYNRDKPADPFRPYGSTVGHGMEWARLCVHLNAAAGSSRPTWLLDAAVHLYTRAKTDGWARDGADGFVYTVDWDGIPVVHERMHWVVAEAAAAASALHQATGDPSYIADFRTWWEFIRTFVIDQYGGSWHHELSRVNQPSQTVWAGKPDAYHALQTCLNPLLPLTPSIALSVANLAPSAPCCDGGGQHAR